MKPEPDRWQVRTQYTIAYDVIRAPHLFAASNDTLLAWLGRAGGRRFVVLDAEVDRHHGAGIRNWFVRHDVDACIAVFPAGERHKTLADWEALLCQLDAFPVHRRDEPIVAIGGGVLTDVAGFVAACYRRGMPHINVPTTLMGYVDAAIGIKTAVNFRGGKNRLGSFTPPLAVLLDPTFLPSLPRRHLLNGTCEIIKLALIRDPTLFARLERDGAASIAAHFANPAGIALLDRAVASMLAELAPNLLEQDLARKVDFGHTFSCGLESHHAGRLLHGEAVLLDILVSTLIAWRRDLFTTADTARVFSLVRRLGIEPDFGALDIEAMWESLLDRIEHRNGRQRVPVPLGIGRCIFLDDITRPELDAATACLGTWLEERHAFAREC